MPKRGKGEIPLPEGWEECLDYDGKRFFIDHNTRQTTWVDPRDRWDILGVFSCIVKQAPCMLLFSILSCNYYVFHHRFGLFFLLYSLEIYLYAPLITNMQCMHWQTYPIREVTRELHTLNCIVLMENFVSRTLYKTIIIYQQRFNSDSNVKRHISRVCSSILLSWLGRINHAVPWYFFSPWNIGLKTFLLPSATCMWHVDSSGMLSDTGQMDVCNL